jgi:hypothetical protein
MDTNLIIAADGSVKGMVHTWTNNKWEGSHAVPVLTLFDQNRTQLWKQELVMCGVAGRWDPTGASDRHCDINTIIPTTILPKIRLVSLLNTENPRSLTWEYLSKAVEVLLRNVTISSGEGENANDDQTTDDEMESASSALTAGTITSVSGGRVPATGGRHGGSSKLDDERRPRGGHREYE